MFYQVNKKKKLERGGAGTTDGRLKLNTEEKKDLYVTHRFYYGSYPELFSPSPLPVRFMSALCPLYGPLSARIQPYPPAQLVDTGKGLITGNKEGALSMNLYFVGTFIT